MTVRRTRIDRQTQVDYRKWVFFLIPMNVVDLVAILPFYIELLLAGAAVPGLSVFRVLRLTRMLRMLKVSKSSLQVCHPTLYSPLV